MRQVWIRSMFTWAIAAAACGGAAGLGPLADEPVAAREARARYVNPGGMWLPAQIALPDHVEALRSLGLGFDPARLADPYAPPLSAVVSIGGCTGALVSGDGLILTSHHCVQDALRIHSERGAGRDLLDDGFLALRRLDEKRIGEVQHVYVEYAQRDVTAQIRNGMDRIKDPVALATREEDNIKAELAACHERRRFTRCYIHPYFGGAMYVESERIELRDVRLVYAPARAVGGFGGELDNWRWPRFAGDWALIRAYVRGDGRPVAYSRDNVPFHTRNYLRVSTAGVAAGDLVVSAGYPASTNRTATAASIRASVDRGLPYRIARAEDRYAIAAHRAGESSDAGVAARLTQQEIQNALARDRALLAQLTTGDAMARKDALERRIRDWAGQAGREVYQIAIARLDALAAERARAARAELARSEAFGGSQLLGVARTATRWAEQRALDEGQRKLGFQDAFLAGALAQLRGPLWSYDRAMDRAVFRRALVRALELPEADRAWLAELLGTARGAPLDEAAIDRTLDAWYRAPPLEDEANRVALVRGATPAQLAASRDPFVQAARRIAPLIAADDRTARRRYGEWLMSAPRYVEAMQQALGQPLAPDANGSLRVTYGTVRGRGAASDPADRPFTTASQLAAHATGTAPLAAPAALLDAIRARRFGRYADPALGDLPIAFLSDLDIAGGSSGSPVIDRAGRLVGVVFDGVLEGAGADVLFDPATARAIAVDVRYLLWTLDLLAGGDDLLEEMGVPPSLP